MSLVKLIDLPSLGDDRGSLISIEANRNIPFKIERVYYIFQTKHGVSRGFHAHRDLQQLVVCVAGSCRMSLNDGKSVESVQLDSPFKGLLISNNMWREIHDFSQDCVLLVLASHHYDENDYIRDYDEFLRCVEC